MTDAVNIRMLALDALIEINENGRFFHQVTRAVLDKYQYLDKSQRAFFSRFRALSTVCCAQRHAARTRDVPYARRMTP